MYTEIIIAIIGVISTVISSVVTWFISKRKYNAEVDNTVIDSMQKSLEFYKQLSDDNKERLDNLLKRNDQLEDEVAELRRQVFNMLNNVCYRQSCTIRELENTIRERETKEG